MMRTVTRDDLATGVGPNHPQFIGILEGALAGAPAEFRAAHAVEVIRVPAPAGNAMMVGVAIVRKELDA